MAYFANGSEGEWYEGKICSRCAHYSDEEPGNTCAVWTIHLLYNGAEDGTPVGQMLDMLIPQQGIRQGLCSMWHPSKPEHADHGKHYQEWLEGKK